MLFNYQRVHVSKLLLLSLCRHSMASGVSELISVVVPLVGWLETYSVVASGTRAPLLVYMSRNA